MPATHPNPLFRIAVIVCLLLPACTTYHRFVVGDPSYEVARRVAPDGSEEVFRLETRIASGDAWLEVRTERDRERPFLGLKVRDLDRAEAERRGLKPFSGLLVDGTWHGSAAAAAGVLAGDVLLALDGTELVYAHQLPDLESRLRPGQQVTARILRGNATVEAALATRALQDRVTDTESVPLVAPPFSEHPYAGVSLRGIPRVWCERMFGAPREAVVITNVEVGAPAWLAGFRGGDLIEAVDDSPVPPVAELSRMIQERGLQHMSITLRVSRGGASLHQATVDLHDYSGTTEVHVPLVFRVIDGVGEDRWSVLPFGMLASNTNRYVTDQTREARTENTFSALLGLFHLRTSPGRSRLRLLWFIRIES